MIVADVLDRSRIWCAWEATVTRVVQGGQYRAATPYGELYTASPGDDGWEVPSGAGSGEIRGNTRKGGVPSADLLTPFEVAVESLARGPAC